MSVIVIHEHTYHHAHNVILVAPSVEHANHVLKYLNNIDILVIFLLQPPYSVMYTLYIDVY